MFEQKVHQDNCQPKKIKLVLGLFYQLFNREVIHSKLQIVTMGHFLYWGVEDDVWDFWEQE